MGANIARRLSAGGHRVVGLDRDSRVATEIAAEGVIEPAADLPSLINALKSPRVVWSMLPAGEATADCIAVLRGLLESGDLIIDGANSRYTDSISHAESLQSVGIGFLDVGVSGGIWGLENGFGLMVGGDEAQVEQVRPLFECLAPSASDGWVHCGPSGAGHFVKMVHNGIEYGMMQSLAEGLGHLREAREFNLDLAEVTRSWCSGSVIRSWLLELTADFLARDADLSDIAPLVEDSGEGRWAVSDAIERGIPVPAIAAALQARFSSQGKADFSSRTLAAMRKAFGGHATS